MNLEFIILLRSTIKLEYLDQIIEILNTYFNYCKLNKEINDLVINSFDILIFISLKTSYMTNYFQRIKRIGLFSLC